MNKTLSLLLILFCFSRTPLVAQPDDDFCHYMDSMKEVISLASTKQFTGEAQVQALQLLDTLLTIEDPDKLCYLSQTYYLLGIGYMSSDFDKSKEYLDLSIETAKQCDDSTPLIHTYNRYAILFASQGFTTANLDSSMVYFEKAKDISLLYNNMDIWVEINLNLARGNIYRGNDDLFIKYLTESQSHAFIGNDSLNIAFAYDMWANFYMKKDTRKTAENFELCVIWFPKSLQAYYIKILNDIILFYREEKNFERMIHHYDELFRIKNFEQEKKFDERYDNLTKKFEVQESKNKLANLELKNKLIQQSANAQENWNRLLIVCTLLFLFGLIFYFRHFRLQRTIGLQLNTKNSELELAKKEAVELAQAKTQFSDTISHELRTPLHGIIGLTSLLISKEKKNLSAEGSDFLDRLKYSSEYLLKLINDVLEISKIDSKSIKLESKSFNVQFFISNLSSSFNNLVKESNNEFIISIDPNIPKYIKGDPIRLSQILINLIGNALKFTQNGKVELIISLVSKNETTLGLLFEIIDNGSGIPKEKQKVIFDKFIQIKNQSSTLHGTGLGLPIVKELLDLFNSQIYLESKVDIGSKFSFEIIFELGKENELEFLKSQKSLNNYGFENSNILIVDDNEINLIVSQKILEFDGYQIQTAINGITAIDKVKNQSFDLILMDLHMPVMDGVETVSEIRKMNKEIPIILITASNITLTWKEYQSKGFDDFIIKPYDKFDFLQMILKHLKETNS